MKQLWTGMVFTRPHVGTSRLELRGRVRVALVKDVWYLQCTDIDKKWFVNVRAPLESTEWRTCYTCPVRLSGRGFSDANFRTRPSALC